MTMSEGGDKTALTRPPWNALYLFGAKMVMAGCRVRMEAEVENLCNPEQLHDEMW